MIAAPVVTALRARGRGRVEVELDGRAWRVVPLEVVYAAGLAAGRELDRASAREVGRELRRFEARGEALRALRARDHTAASLERRLASKGAAGPVRREAVEAAQRAGLVDDRRFAVGRAELLARRGAGDLLIASDLERHGLSGGDIHAAIGHIAPESERALAIIETRGRSARTARYLASKGFSEAAIEPLVAELTADAIE